MLDTAAGTPAPAAPIPPADRSRPLPLAPAQQWMWLLHELDPASPSYNLPLAFRLAGALDEVALRTSLAALTARHESLRTTFPLVDGVPIQAIAPHLAVPVVVRDLRAVPAADREATAQTALRAALGAGFDLAQGPLWRVLLLRLAPEEHILLLTLHHSIADGWSQGVLVRELATLYAGLVLDAPVDLPALPVQSDKVRWHYL